MAGLQRSSHTPQDTYKKIILPSGLLLPAYSRSQPYTDIAAHTILVLDYRAKLQELLALRHFCVLLALQVVNAPFYDPQQVCLSISNSHKKVQENGQN